MSINPQLVTLESELADLDQELSAVDRRRDLSDGQKVLLKGSLQQKRQKKYLEREILKQKQAVEASERDVGEAQKRFEWAQTRDGLKVLLKREMLRLAGNALGGGTHGESTLFDRRSPERRVNERAKGDLARTEDALRRAQDKLSDLTRQLQELKTQDVDWVRLNTQTTILPAEAGGESPGLREAAESAGTRLLQDSAGGRIQLGRWAAQRDEELRKVNRFALGTHLTEQDVRDAFPSFLLWGDVMDQLHPKRKERFFDEIGRLRWKQSELFELMGDVRGMSGSTLYDYYKEYRRDAGLGRKHMPPKRKSSSAKKV